MTITEVEHVAHVRESAEFLGDHDELQRRWEADGYLFLRGVIDKDALEAVRREYMKLLAAQGMVESIDGKSLWTGVPAKGSRPIAYEDLGEPVSRDLVTHPSFDRTIRAVLGEVPSWVPIVSYRAAVPNADSTPDDLFYARHQDGYYNKGIDFRICWVPLMEIPSSVGGLAIAPGYHKKGFLHKENGESRGISELVPDESWRRADYQPGHVLIFHNLTPHAPLVNHSDVIRLSIDVRVLPESARNQPVIGTIVSEDDTSPQIAGDDGAIVSLVVDENTYFRGIGPAVERLGPGSRVIASTDDDGKHAVVVRLAT